MRKVALWVDDTSNMLFTDQTAREMVATSTIDLSQLQSLDTTDHVIQLASMGFTADEILKLKHGGVL